MGLSAQPLVSCIMPTRNRSDFVSQAVQCFLRQDYEPRELMVVDDGTTPIDHLLPDDERIRYLRLDRRATLGEKRNIACDAARGEFIAHWDDDDWSGRDRLSAQVSELERSGADVCGARSLLHYALEPGQAWLYGPRNGERPSLLGGTLVYRRSAWAGSRFPDARVGEDGAFVRAFAPERVRSLEDPPYYVALIHRRNTAAKNLTDRRWQRRPVGEVTARLGAGMDFYLGLRNGGRRRPSCARPSSRVTVAAPFVIYDGYGSMAEYLVRGMQRAGAQLDVLPLDVRPEGLSGEMLEILHRSRKPTGGPALYFCWPNSNLERLRGASELFVNTMWEGDRLPRGWAGRLNRATAVIVPTRSVADACRASGVEAPIEVIPEGIDPEVYHLEERPEREGLTTLIVATVVPRKNTLIGIEAWKRAFRDDPAARLVIKSRFSYGNYEPDDPRIEFVDRDETSRGIAHWYRRADVLLALGNEGFGLPLVEGMATGLPVVALDSEGQRDVCAEAGNRLLSVPPARRVPFDDQVFGRCGHRGVPSTGDIAERLRWVADHREEARAVGRAAAEWVPAHRDVWRKGPAVLDVMERRVRPQRSLRRSRTMWVTTLGRPCGLAEESARLGELIPGLVLRAQRPQPGAARLIHVQYEPSVISDSDVLTCAEDARAARVPVAVTLHGVFPRQSAFESAVDALVTTTERGAELLRARCPEACVRHIPIGCPTWFPPRKRRRGRVIASFGFLHRHKGFWALLHALRELRGAELLLFSHARSPGEAEEFDAAAAGLPVRRVGDYLPAAEIASRLAAEADVLAYWYDEVGQATSSAAVRTGLASGVPVLASRTGWFAGLEEAVYQPDDLVDGLAHLLDDTGLRRRVTAAARDYCQSTSWPRIARRHVELWDELEAI
jgi:glycosyltransferase involved in cell wall biosynthesis